VRLPKMSVLQICAAACVLFGGTVAYGSTAYKTITLHTNGGLKVYRGFLSGTVGAWLKQEHIHLASGSRISPGLKAIVSNGMQVDIVAPDTIQLEDGMVSQQFQTFSKTVGQFIHDQGIRLGPEDTLNVSTNTTIQNGMRLQIRRQSTEVFSKTREIPFQTIRQRTDNLYVGQQRVLTHGVKGSLEVKTTNVFVNGKRMRNFVASQVKMAPVNEVLEIGAKMRPLQPAPVSSRSEDTLISLKQFTVVATAYEAGGRTSTGWSAGPGVIAVDPNVIPYGTKLYIPGVGVVRAEDSGSAIVGNRIDICMASLAEADNWGRQTITVYVLR